MSCKNHKINRYHIRMYKENARRNWKCLGFWEKLLEWKFLYKRYEDYFVRSCLSSRYWKYGNY